jgi:transcriptional regulator with XRE-family HTH domain
MQGYFIGVNVVSHLDKILVSHLLLEKSVMLSDTLTAGLKRYEIGSKVRALRVKKKLGLVQLGEHTGLSPALLSKIERGQLFPTLPTLLRIAMVFGVGLDHFFVESEERPLVVVNRKKDRVRLPNRPGEETPSYFFESLNFAMTDRIDIYYAEFPEASKSSGPHEHAGAEFLYILQGRLIVSVDGKDVVLDEGDAVQFDSSAAHSYRLDHQHQGSSSAIVVVMPEPS